MASAVGGTAVFVGVAVGGTVVSVAWLSVSLLALQMYSLSSGSRIRRVAVGGMACCGCRRHCCIGRCRRWRDGCIGWCGCRRHYIVKFNRPHIDYAADDARVARLVGSDARRDQAVVTSVDGRAVCIERIVRRVAGGRPQARFLPDNVAVHAVGNVAVFPGPADQGIAKCNRSTIHITVVPVQGAEIPLAVAENAIVDLQCGLNPETIATEVSLFSILSTIALLLMTILLAQ